MPKAANTAELGVVGSTVRYYREQRGLTQEQLGARAGLVTSTIVKVEAEDVSPGFETTCKIADALGVTTDALRRRVV